MGLTDDDWNAWRAMESIHDSRQTRMLGVSNVSLEQLQLLCQKARVKPSFVQNRCYAITGWDRDVRAFCAANNIVYQGFSLLTANTAALSRPEIAAIAKRHGHTIAQITFRFAIEVGMLPLTGTTNPDYMRSDLNIFDFQLDAQEIDQIERIAQR
jgi:diketogulonate reductase-like aldo/keto reductase